DVSAVIASLHSPATIARLPAAKSGSSAAQSAVSTIDPMVEQMGHASAGVTVSETTLPARAGVARSCQAGAVKKYDVGTATDTPTTAAIRIERAMIVAPLTGCLTSPPGSLLIPCLGSLPLDHGSLGLADFHSIGIRVLGHLSKISEISRGLLGLIGGVRGLRCAVQAAQPLSTPARSRIPQALVQAAAVQPAGRLAVAASDRAGSPSRRALRCRPPHTLT